MLDFRAVVAFSAAEAFLMASGPGDQSRIYHTKDSGQHWQLQFTNTNPKGFFDSMVLWDPRHGIVLGDPIADENGRLHFELLVTDDGQTWRPIPPKQLPDALDGEGAFAASNTCLAILHDPWKTGPSGPHQPPEESRVLAHASPDPNIWFASGGKTARVFHSSDGGESWKVHETPLVQGTDSAGIFSIVFRNPSDGVIAGGDYKHPDGDGPNLAFTHDGGKTWDLATIHPQAYFSAAAYDSKASADLRIHQSNRAKAEMKKNAVGQKPSLRQRLFIVSQAFVLDARSSTEARRLTAKTKIEGAINAISPFPEGGAVLVGAKGVIVIIR